MNDKRVDGIMDTDETHEAQHLNDNGEYPYDNCSRCVAETGTPYLPPDYGGPVVQCADCGNDAPNEPCKRHEQPDGPLCQPCRLGQLYLHMLCWHCGGQGGFTWNRSGVIEWARVVSFNNDDEAVIDDHSWDSDLDGNADIRTWVQHTCGTRVAEDVSYDIMATR